MKSKGAKTYKSIVVIMFLLIVNANQSAKSQEDKRKYPPIAYKNFNYENYRFKSTNLIPISGVVAIASIQHTPFVKNINEEIKTQVGKLNFHTSIDDYLQLAPAITAFGLDAVGVYGKHHILDKTLIFASIFLIESFITTTMKYSFKTMRPDGSAHNSFPSGHTATAFMGAEFLRREYGEKSIFYTIGGYSAAFLTAYLRVQNNRHWLTDIAAGACIGIVSVSIAYYLYPCLMKLVFNGKIKKFSPEQTVVLEI